MNEFKKYKESRQRTDAFLKKVHRKSVSRLKKKKHTTKKYTIKKKTSSNNQNTDNTPITADDIFNYLDVLIGCAICFVIILLLITYGIKNILISIVAIIGVILIVIFIQSIKEVVEEQKKIEYLKSLLPEIDSCKDIINNSSNAEIVKTNLNRLLIIMDEIIDTPEEILNKAGMTNSTMPQQKENVLKNYDILIKQAEEINQ